MNRRNLLAAIAAAATGGLWRKKPDPPSADWTTELLDGLFEVMQQNYYQNELPNREICIEEANTPSVFAEKRRILALRSCTLDGKGIQAREFYWVMVATIPDFHRRYQEFKDSRDPEIKKKERLYEKKVNGDFDKMLAGSQVFALRW